MTFIRQRALQVFIVVLLIVFDYVYVAHKKVESLASTKRK